MCTHTHTHTLRESTEFVMCVCVCVCECVSEWVSGRAVERQARCTCGMRMFIYKLNTPIFVMKRLRHWETATLRHCDRYLRSLKSFFGVLSSHERSEGSEVWWWAEDRGKTRSSREGGLAARRVSFKLLVYEALTVDSRIEVSSETSEPST